MDVKTFFLGWLRSSIAVTVWLIAISAINLFPTNEWKFLYLIVASIVIGFIYSKDQTMTGYSWSVPVMLAVYYLIGMVAINISVQTFIVIAIISFISNLVYILENKNWMWGLISAGISGYILTNVIYITFGIIANIPISGLSQ